MLLSIFAGFLVSSASVDLDLCGIALPPAVADAPEDKTAASAVDDYLETIDELLPITCELGRLAAIDQYARRRLTEKFKTIPEGSDSYQAYTDAVGPHLDKIDKITTSRLKEILKSVTWRQLASDRHYLFGYAYLIVQHSKDHEFMRQALRDIEPLAQEGLVGRDSYASLYDRVQLNSGGRQRYGTQISCKDGVRGARNLEDPDNVDKRRAEFGMRPLGEYLSQIDDVYGSCGEPDTNQR